MVFSCKDHNPKIIKVEFDTGSLQKKDEWLLCKNCSNKPEFQKHRVNIERVNST